MNVMGPLSDGAVPKSLPEPRTKTKNHEPKPKPKEPNQNSFLAVERALRLGLGLLLILGPVSPVGILVLVLVLDSRFLFLKTKPCCFSKGRPWSPSLKPLEVNPLYTEHGLAAPVRQRENAQGV